MPGQNDPEGVADIVRDGVTGAVTDSVAKLLPELPVAMPVIPLATFAYTFPVVAVVVSGCTCRPVIVIWSGAAMPLTVILTVNPVAVTVPAIPVILDPVTYDMVGRVVPNCQPAAGCKMSVQVPALKSATVPSEMTIEPRLVNAGALPVSAFTLQISVPPVPAVTDTALRAAGRQPNISTSIPINFQPVLHTAIQFLTVCAARKKTFSMHCLFYANTFSGTTLNALCGGTQ